MGADYRYRAFLSYSHEDRKWADWLHRELERYRVPPRLRSLVPGRTLPANLRPVFRDQEELASAASLPDVIDNALEESESLIVICSPAAARSRWVDNEVRRFQELGRGDRILCLIVDGEPLAGDDRDCFPPSLRQAGEHGKAHEPIAADARGGRGARHHARTMIIAGLLGVGLDELLQRDLHRRHRNMFVIASGATLLAVIMAGLTVFAFLAKSESERRRADAENLVGFMLGDLRSDLHAIGRLDLYRTVADEAMEYFQSLGEEDARDEVLAQRALALSQIGRVRFDLGDLPGAMNAYEEARELTVGIAQRNPDRAEWQLDLATAHFTVGEVHWQLGNYDAAQAEFLKQLSVVDSLVVTNPDDPELIANSGYAWTNFGRIMERHGQLEAARDAYDRVMSIFLKYRDLQPDNNEADLEVGFAHNNLGKLKMSLGLLEEAEAHMREDLGIKRNILRDDPGHNLWREYLASSEYWLARVLLLLGTFSEAIELGENAMERLDALILTDPEQTRWRHRRADIARVVARGCRLSGDLACAEENIEASLADLVELVAINAESADWRRSQAQSQLEAAWQAVSAGDSPAAFALVQAAMQTAGELTLASPEDHDSRKVEILALLTLGDLAEQAGEGESADGHRQSAQGLLEAWFAASPDPEMRDAQAILLARTDQAQAAETIRTSLDALGYHSPFPPSPGP